MAPNVGSTAAPRQPTRKAPARIVPAIPLALTRAPPSARPITPEDTATETVTQQDAEPPPAEEKSHEHGLEDPLTPQSKASALNQGEGEPRSKTPASSIGAPEASLETQSPSSSSHPNSRLFPQQLLTLPDDSELATAQHDAADEEPHSAELHHSDGPSEDAEPTAVTEVIPAASEPSHNHHASLDSIVFGTSQESPPLPSTPRDVEPNTTTLPQPVQRHPPGFAPPQFATPFYPGHSYHPSNPQAQFPPPVAPLPLISQNGVPHPPPEFHPLAFSGQLPHHGSFQRQPSPHHAPVAANGIAASHPESPIKSQASEHEEERHPGSHQNGTHLATANSTPPSSEPTKFREPFELADYLSSQFGNPEFADFVLRVHSEDATLLNIPVHGIVVARSRTIASAIRSVPPVQQSKGAAVAVDIFTRDRFITPEALSEAIKVLYGAPLLPVESFIYGLGPFRPEGEQSPSFTEARIRMNQAISYAAAGKLFQLHSMHERGIEIMKALLRWDTFDQALVFGLDSHPYPHGRPVNRTEPGSAPSPEAYYATRILEHDVSDFVAYNFPPNFRLYTIAPELKHAPRLPSIAERITHNPRLSRIRFGDVPPEDELQPDYVARALSGALLSMPLPLLDYLLNHRAAVRSLGWERLQTIMQEIVDERERRRQKAVKSGAGLADGVSNVLAENLLWVEHNLPSAEHVSGRTLAETRDTNYV